MFLGSFLVYLIASIISAVTNNIWLLCLMRVFQALGTSADQCVGAGIISDIFIPTGHYILFNNNNNNTNRFFIFIKVIDFQFFIFLFFFRKRNWVWIFLFRLYNWANNWSSSGRFCD